MFTTLFWRETFENCLTRFLQTILVVYPTLSLGDAVAGGQIDLTVLQRVWGMLLAALGFVIVELITSLLGALKQGSAGRIALSATSFSTVPIQDVRPLAEAIVEQTDPPADVVLEPAPAKKKAKKATAKTTSRRRKDTGGALVDLLLWIIAVVAFVAAIVQLLTGHVAAGVVLLIVACVIGPGGYSLFHERH